MTLRSNFINPSLVGLFENFYIKYTSKIFIVKPVPSCVFCNMKAENITSIQLQMEYSAISPT